MMQVLPFSVPGRTAFPYIVTMGSGRNARSRLDVYDGLEIGGTGPHGLPTSTGIGGQPPVDRDKLSAFFSRRSQRSGQTHCIVWAENACTYLLADGGVVDGRRPPEADTLDPRDYSEVPFPLIDLWHIALPSGCRASHICIRRLTSDWVEVTSGAPVVLAYFDEAWEGEGPDPVTPMLDEQGRLVAPASYRGAPVTGIRDGWTLLGPIQPDGEAERVVRPWPDEIHKACAAIAGRQLPVDLLAAAWRAVDPMQLGMNFVGVLKAA